MDLKAVFQVGVHPQSLETVDLMQSLFFIILETLRSEYALDPDWLRFQTGLRYKSEDDSLLLQTATYKNEDAYPFLWALRLRVRDSVVRRRNWTIHIGIRQHSQNLATLYYALLHADYQAGSLTSFSTPCLETPLLFDMLLSSRRVQCLSGAHALPAHPWNLTDDDIERFSDSLTDPERHNPIVLITCPDLVSPSRLFARVKGNLIVCWLDDYELYDRLCTFLPQERHLPWDSIRVYLPFSGEMRYNPLFLLADINRLGEQGMIDLLFNAYCTGFRGEDRRAFPDLETIHKLLNDRHNAKLASNNAELQDCLDKALNMHRTVSEKCGVLEAQLADAQRRLAKSDADEYEELLGESMRETDTLKAGLNAITARLYTESGDDFLPAAWESAELRDLTTAIRTRLNRIRDKRR